MGNTVANR